MALILCDQTHFPITLFQFQYLSTKKWCYQENPTKSQLFDKKNILALNRINQLYNIMVLKG